MHLSSFPQKRMRRLRQNQSIRDLLAETQLNVKDLIWPTFVMPGKKQQQAIDSMPGVFRYSLDVLLGKIKEAQSLGIQTIALFPKTPDELKSNDAQEAINANNLICSTLREIKSQYPELLIMTDVALDPYTKHGHDGVFNSDQSKIDNDASVGILAQQALVQAQAGSDIIGPSDMMDGRVAAIRAVLEDNTLHDTLILSYAAKYASSYYGPFRDAVGSQQTQGISKKTYQQDFRNGKEALHEVALDLQEGADMVMVKPGLPYLDIIAKVVETFQVPTFAYQVSGEYSMIKLAEQQGLAKENQLMLESLTSLKRAGCTGILSYAALEIAKIL